jgi:hypothetical protein
VLAVAGENHHMPPTREAASEQLAIPRVVLDQQSLRHVFSRVRGKSAGRFQPGHDLPRRTCTISASRLAEAASRSRSVESFTQGDNSRQEYGKIGLKLSGIGGSAAARWQHAVDHSEHIPSEADDFSQARQDIGLLGVLELFLE